jgi:hypothetical protein
MAGGTNQLKIGVANDLPAALGNQGAWHHLVAPAV